ncbi:bifunctional helix-turn-helix transcriptional regulator/GNAT family N-acetyltransferase [Pseudomonas fluorescens]|jgi:DNA-binding MarR family transcriptional regulator/GNAT superfamily N-acetyltransferase|uniref:bifunctional helix-turn-helix transcriptional regulator/GNAT family N-acetyltransferase n=1 Tax=unclassified Pseudomonas TaxID=196821 RepID=UPI000D0F8B43|nr:MULTISPECIES: bifunctional helix-turn-helix transcriptional regulator/GNAT family N-acetyltransferase [unclassified Pseudomonas]AYF49126.1 GNAT family N-acetyltransferase [Pseudomonas fluorescens]MBS7845307.1 bifunctional helix-turn-helix transcriptional regulator/GNAT family N-acetyltransferase [Pseudomonas fluorescens]QTV16805.1 bifunctional helix-turn-helix transcriptional regulator/GNAT family N-acetyltransferase [Pseudomonas fluorescens]
MSTPQLVERAGIVRGFNRFYTHQIGVLQEHLLQSDFSLTEIRVMYELSSRGDLTSADLCQMLSLDAGYLSRLTSGLEKNRLIQKVRSPTDARAVLLHLSDLGRAVLAPLEQQTQNEVIALLDALPDAQQRQLTGAMQRIQALLQGTAPTYLLRDPQPGDMGLVVQQQSALYAREYGWNWEFEALVAEIVAKYLREFDPTCERCWIAEKDGEVVGSVFVVRHDATTAKLRMLYVDASARGMGIGQRLVDECLRFARQAGYTSMLLWTVNILTDARKLYQKAGFELTEEEPTVSFGKTLVSETWVRAL